MKIPLIPEDLHHVKEGDVRRVLLAMHSKIVRAVNGRLDFGSPQGQSKGVTGNIDGTWTQTILTPGANVEFTITHNLGRIPVGYDVKSIDQAAIIYDSRKNQWTTTQMFLKCNTATVNVVLFIH